MIRSSNMKRLCALSRVWARERYPMSNCRKTVSSEQRRAVSRKRRTAYCLLLTAYCLLFFTACRQDMQDQPRYEAYESSNFFKDGLSARPYPTGTVPRGYLRADAQFYTGKITKAGGSNVPGGQTTAGRQNQ